MGNQCTRVDRDPDTLQTTQLNSRLQHTIFYVESQLNETVVNCKKYDVPFITTIGGCLQQCQP